MLLPGIPHLVMFLILAEPQFSVLILTSLKKESVLCDYAGPHHSTVQLLQRVEALTLGCQRAPSISSSDFLPR